MASRVVVPPAIDPSGGERIVLNQWTIEGFVNVFLRSGYEDSAPVCQLHRDIWELECDPHEQVAIAAPRKHGKTTAGTIAYILAAICFRQFSYVLLMSKTLDQATEFLFNIKQAFVDNDDLRAAFKIRRFHKCNEGEIIGEFEDGQWFRVLVKGSDQDFRGALWGNRRPQLILLDDAEGDAQVESDYQRKKYRRWVLKVLLPMGSKHCKIRILGTILHYDSLLARLTQDPEWLHRIYRAHATFDDFSGLLWPEHLPEEWFRKKRQTYISAGEPELYAQEYLNIPLVEGDAFFREQDFIAMESEDYDEPKTYYVGGDFAISEEDHANYTVFLVGGLDSHGRVHVVDRRKGRWDGLGIWQEMKSIHDRYHPDEWFFEKGTLEKALGPFLYLRMVATARYMTLTAFTAIRSKEKRAQTFRAMMRAGAVRFDENMDGYEDYKRIMLRFQGLRKGEDDDVDASAWLGQGVHRMIEPDEEDLLREQEEEEMDEDYVRDMRMGACVETGY